MDLLIKAENIYVEYLDREILNIPDLEVYTYDRIGIVGNIGAGKTTLLKILSGVLTIPNCKVQMFGEIAYFEQIKDVDIETNADKKLLGKLGIHNILNDNMSGGEQIKYRAAHLLSKESHGILADEPTCNMDKEGIDYLIHKLYTYQGALILVSHDRYFLDSMVNKIWEIEEGQLTEYYGNYTDYRNQLEEKKQAQETKHQLYVKELNRLNNVYDKKVKKAEKVSKKPGSMSGKRNIPNINDMTKAYGSREKTLYKSARNVQSRIENMDKVEKPKKEMQIKFAANPELELHNKFPIEGKEIKKVFGTRVIFDEMSFNIPLGAKVAITGSNGSGKTTLLNMILNREPGITVSLKAVIGHFEQNGYHHISDCSVMEYAAKDCAYKISVLRAMLTSLGFTGNDLKKNTHDLSGGERVKCMLCKLLTGRYNILLLDEPSNYLDIKSVLALEQLMKDYKGTIIFVSHDDRLVDEVADVIYKIENGKMWGISRRK